MWGSDCRSTLINFLFDYFQGLDVPEPNMPPPPLPPQNDVYDLDVAPVTASPQRQAPPIPPQSAAAQGAGSGAGAPPPLPMRRAAPPAVPTTRPNCPPPLPARPANNPQ